MVAFHWVEGVSKAAYLERPALHSWPSRTSAWWFPLAWGWLTSVQSYSACALACQAAAHIGADRSPWKHSQIREDGSDSEPWAWAPGARATALASSPPTRASPVARTVGRVRRRGVPGSEALVLMIPPGTG